jgi:hypothetical protein
MDASQDIVVAISPEREKFFGRSGTMLIPSPETVAAFIQELPTNKLITTELLRQELAMRHQADVTCPAAMQKALRTIARRTDDSVPYWRVVKKDGSPLSIFPGGVTGQATLLEQAGFVMETKKEMLRVQNLAENLASFS